MAIKSATVDVRLTGWAQVVQNQTVTVEYDDEKECESDIEEKASNQALDEQQWEDWEVDDSPDRDSVSVEETSITDMDSTDDS